VSGSAIAGKTDHNGVTSIYIANGTTTDLTLARDDRVGMAEPADAFDMDIAPVDRAALMSITTDEIHTRRKEGTVETTTTTPAMRRSIADAIQRSGIPEHLHKQYSRMFELFADVIAESPTDSGNSKTVVHEIKLSSREPVYTKQYSLPDADLATIRQQVQDWLAMGIIERSHSKFNSAVFCVRRKQDNALSVVLDYRRLNAHTLPNRYNIRTAEELVMEVGKSNCSIFSKIDLQAGFWQMDLAKEARPLTAFTILGEGQFQWCRGARGLTGCPSSFARLIEIATRGLENTVSQIHDLLTFSKSHAAHITHLTAVFIRLRLHGLKINLEKCVFGATETEYLGHTFTPKGIKPGLDKTRAIQRTEPPTTPKELKSYLGMCNYFRNYVGHFSRKTAPLFTLVRQDSQWKSGPLPPWPWRPSRGFRRN
jgi:hypothetical protein